MRILWRTFLLALSIIAIFPQNMGPGRAWRYELIHESGFMDDCPICGRPSFYVPIRGSFELVGTENPRVFQIANVRFVSDFSKNPQYLITGSGTMNNAGVSPTATWSLMIRRADHPDETLEFLNATIDPRIFPMLALAADENTQSLARVYRLRVLAAPFREMWFSTASGMTSGTPELGRVSDGDLLSDKGRVVKRHGDLTRLLSIPPEEAGLDALDIGARGEVFFSFTRDVESIVNGRIGHGSLVTSEGRVILHNSQLLSAFNIVEETDAGLDALQAMPNEEYYFSISAPVTRKSGGQLRRGDILSNLGRVIRTEPSLLLRWQNPFQASVGVDAFHIWPNGEVWFSPESGFESPLGTVQQGDIISDQGYFVFRNLDLLNRFNPLEDLADFGLDGLTIISDISASSNATQFSDFYINNNAAELSWSGAAKVFQVEKAGSVTGPWAPITEIILERAWRDEAIGNGAGFYRLRQW